MQNFLFRPFCRFLKDQLLSCSVLIETKVPNYFSSQKDVTNFLSHFQNIEEFKIHDFIQNLISKISLAMDRPHDFIKFFLDYSLNCGNVALAKKIFLQELHYCLSLRRCGKAEKLIKVYAYRVSMNSEELQLYQMIILMIKGESQKLQDHINIQRKEFLFKYYEVIAFFLRRKMFRDIDQDELLKIKIESMAMECRDALDRIEIESEDIFHGQAKQLLDFLLEELYLNPEKDFLFQYTQQIVNSIFSKDEESNSYLRKYNDLSILQTESESIFKYYNLQETKKYYSQEKSKTTEDVVRRVINNFKLMAVDHEEKQSHYKMRLRGIAVNDWQELLGDGRDIIDLLRTTDDSLKLKNYIINELDKKEICIGKRISLLGQLVFLLEREGNIDLAYSLSAYLSRALPRRSTDWLMFHEISEKLSVEIKTIRNDLAA